LLNVARQRAGCETVYHRAFDVVADPIAALERIIDLGFTRVLTSGRAPRAVDGLDEIRRTRERTAGRIEVLPGGGINAATVARVVAETGVDQVHLSATRIVEDTSTAANPVARFGADLPPNEAQYRATDQDTVRAVRMILDSRAG
jgi:copper homeostasis protein